MKHMLRNLNYLMKYIWQTEKRYILLRVPQILLNALKPFIMVIFPKLIIDKLTQANYGEDAWRYTATIIIIMILLNFVVNVILRILYTCITNSYNSFSSKHTINVGRKIMSMEYKHIENPEVLDLFERTKDAGYCENIYSSISNIISNSLTCIGLLVVLSQINIIIICVILIVVVINVFCNRKIQKYDYQWHIEAAPYKRVSSYLTNLMQNFQYGKDIRLFNEAEYLTTKYNKFKKSYLHKLYTITIKFLKLNLVTTIINIIQQGGVYFYLAFELFKKRITIGSFTMLLSSIQQFTECLVDISNNVVNIGNYTRYIEEFSQIMSYEDIINRKGLNISDSENVFIEFKNVWFKYPGSDNFALKNINTAISNKEKLSIVGTNGSGKTTFIKLLLRLYQPTKGEILVNGININEIDYNSYINLFSTVFQDYKILAYSISENITLQDDYNDPRVCEILKQLNLYDKVMQLSKGLDTMLSKEFDPHGIELSGGEQQKIVIARALFRNSKLLILDEPTSALDPLMEYDIYSTVMNSINDRGIIFISHRLSVTQFCDKVSVFDQGEIIQSGTHQSLMAMPSGLYHEMYSKQAEFYKDKEANYEL